MAVKIPETGPGSRDPKSYGVARIANTPFGQDVAGFFKKGSAALAARNDQLVQDRESGNTVGKIARKVGDYFGGTGQKTLLAESNNLGQTLKSNTFRPSISQNPSVTPSPVNIPSVGAPSVPGPAQLAQAEMAPASRVKFVGTSPVIANTGNGGVGLFDKNGVGMDPASLVGKMGKMNPNAMERDYSGQAGLDQQVFEMSMARAKDGTLPVGGPFGPPGQGAGTYSKDSLMQQDVQRRDMLLSQIDGFNRKNTLGPNAKLGDIVNNAMATRDMRREVKGLNDNIFGRSDLANKIQMAILDSMTKQDVATQTNQTDLAKQGLENQGQFDTRQMMEGHEDMRTAAQIKAGQYAGGQAGKAYDQQGFYDLIKSVGVEGAKKKLELNPDEDLALYTKNFWTGATGSSPILKDLLNNHR